jgi:adiponectin receptor
LTYICFGSSAITFTAHGMFLYGFAEQRKRLALEWMGLMGFLNLAGAAIYALRVRPLRYLQ